MSKHRDTWMAKRHFCQSVGATASFELSFMLYLRGEMAVAILNQRSLLCSDGLYFALVLPLCTDGHQLLTSGPVFYALATAATLICFLDLESCYSYTLLFIIFVQQYKTTLFHLKAKSWRFNGTTSFCTYYIKTTSFWECCTIFIVNLAFLLDLKVMPFLSLSALWTVLSSSELCSTFYSIDFVTPRNPVYADRRYVTGRRLAAKAYLSLTCAYSFKLV